MNIGIASDLPQAIAALRRALACEPGHRVLWVAASGTEAVARCALQRPDVLLMDLQLPMLDGVEATRQIMTSTPCAILIVTADLECSLSEVSAAMGHGAVGALETPGLAPGDPAATARPLLRKLRNLAWLNAPGAARPSAGKPPQRGARPQRSLVAIGASAGGPAALAELFGRLPQDFSAAIVVVQHVDESFAGGMADWLTTQSRIPVRLARPGEVPQPGRALLAGSGNHIRMLRGGELGYSDEPGSHIYRPSIDVFFDSVAEHWPGEAVGVLLTGMGSDGARGLGRMRRRGFLTLAQDEGSSAVYGMPKAAAALGAAAEIRPLSEISGRLVELFG
ncbi:Chemotaxis response regulator protein-glutamate methylesterase [compost metagenome]